MAQATGTSAGIVQQKKATFDPDALASGIDVRVPTDDRAGDARPIAPNINILCSVNNLLDIGRDLLSTRTQGVSLNFSTIARYSYRS